MPRPEAAEPDGVPEGPRPKVRAQSLYGLLFVALFGGLAAAVFAAYETVDAAASAVCSTSGYVSCAKVGASGHTTFFGLVPDWSIGIGGYVAMIVVAVLAYRAYDRRFLELLAVLSAVGIGISLYFVYEETFVIQALCPVCTTAHLLNVLVFAVTLWLLRLSRPDPGTPVPRSGPSGTGA